MLARRLRNAALAGRPHVTVPPPTHLGTRLGAWPRCAAPALQLGWPRLQPGAWPAAVRVNPPVPAPWWHPWGCCIGWAGHGGGAALRGWRGLSGAAAAPRAGDVREMLTDPSRWQRHDGKRWERKCEVRGCEKQPSWGTEVKVRRRCGKHREEGDVNVVSLRCPVCLEEGKITQPAFGREGGKAERCGEHREEGDVDVVSQRCPLCLEEGKITQPYFGREGGKAKRCRKHREEGDVFLKASGSA